MKTPKIVFTYSWVYDQKCKEWNKLSGKKVKYPSSEKIMDYFEKIKPLWKKHEKKILTELSRVSGLKWKKDEIQCYVVGRIIPFSDPLTIQVFNNYHDFIDTLVHELIHQLFTQHENFERSKKAWCYIDRKFKNESRKTRVHIPLLALHSYIYLKFFDEDRLNRDRSLTILDYNKAWGIVQKIGYEKIIKEFTKRIE